MVQLNWGILGTGSIANQFAKALQETDKGHLAAVGSRSLASAQAFEVKFPGITSHGSYGDLMADPSVEAVYIANPHPGHAEWAVKAARAGKHVLCEKPVGMNHAEAMAIFEAAEANNVFAMEAFMYRCHPQTKKLVDLIQDGAIGEVRLVRASFGFDAPFDANSRLFNNALGGGGILDVGCYPVSMSRLVAGAASGRPFLDPVDVTAVGELGDTGIDQWTAATLHFENGIVAQASTAVSLWLDNTVTVFGSKGNIHVGAPWHPTLSAGTFGEIQLNRFGAASETISIGEPKGLYVIEAETVADTVAAGKTQADAMSWEDSLGNMATLDAWRREIGLRYDAEKPANVTRTVSGEPLAFREEAAMPYGRIGTVDKPISRLVMGCDNQTTMPHAAIMFDDFVERGGNCFDTAHLYGDGIMEKLLGQWMTNRAIRDELVVIGKGAHSPNCFPQTVPTELAESLGRLQTDYVDVYFLHRDNLDVPVGEFVDVLNQHVQAGQIKAFGGSNWTAERIDEANAYAASKGLQGFQAVSNNFSLARMENPVWPGCIAASDDPYRNWLSQNDVALMCWSSQARGFFTERAGPDKRDDAELVNAWYSDNNFERRERCYELAAKKGVAPVHIALAYVLAQPFAPFALIGPRTIAEAKSSFKALSVSLSEEEVAWLDLRA